jgi:hypothetical protein
MNDAMMGRGGTKCKGKMYQKSSALSILFVGGETLTICDSTNIVAKKPQPLL